MLKLKDTVNIEELTKIGFKTFKVSREQTNYYFAVKRGIKVILINNIKREGSLGFLFSVFCSKKYPRRRGCA